MLKMSFKTIAIVIDGLKTDIAVSEFVDNYFIVLSQFEKFGAIVTIKKDSIQGFEEDRSVYTIKTVLGDEEGPAHIVARYLVEQLNLKKPAVFSVSLRDSSLRTLRAIAKALRDLHGDGGGITVSVAKFGQLVIGPPGSGKSTYCDHMAKLLTEIGRKVAIVNLDPANDLPSYSATVDVQELITVEDVMTHIRLGPNGGLVYSMEYLEKNMDWLTDKLASLPGYYFIFDCPGQVELYTHHNSMKNIMSKLQELNFRLCTVHLVDSHYCSDPGKFISTLLLSMTAMLQMELPHINILSKIDQVEKHGEKLRFGLDYYTEVLDLDYLLDSLQQDPFTAKYKKLNAAIVSLVESHSLVSFLPLSVRDKQLLLRVRSAIDRAGGYIYGAGEERSVQALLACAVGAEPESDRTGAVRDQYTDTDTAVDDEGLMMVDDPT